VSAKQPTTFIHRINRDGNIDSFCRKCLITVASSQWEAELDSAETSHECDPIQLEYVQGVLNRPAAQTALASNGWPRPFHTRR
jgi:hypothetical protein